MPAERDLEGRPVRARLSATWRALVHLLVNLSTAVAAVIDPEVVAQLLTRPGTGPIASLMPRERDVLDLMAQGHDNATIAARLVVADNAAHKHIGNIFAKLGLSPSDGGHRRVRAVLAYLDGARND